MSATGKFKKGKYQYECLQCFHLGWTKSSTIKRLFHKLELTVIYVLDYCKNCGSHSIYYETRCCNKCGYAFRKKSIEGKHGQRTVN